MTVGKVIVIQTRCIFIAFYNISVGQFVPIIVIIIISLKPDSGRRIRLPESGLRLLIHIQNVPERFLIKQSSLENHRTVVSNFKDRRGSPPDL